MLFASMNSEIWLILNDIKILRLLTDDHIFKSIANTLMQINFLKEKTFFHFYVSAKIAKVKTNAYIYIFDFSKETIFSVDPISNETILFFQHDLRITLKNYSFDDSLHKLPCKCWFLLLQHTTEK